MRQGVGRVAPALLNEAARREARAVAHEPAAALERALEPRAAARHAPDSSSASASSPSASSTTKNHDVPSAEP